MMGTQQAEVAREPPPAGAEALPSPPFAHVKPNKFPIPEEELIRLARDALSVGVDNAKHAENFKFTAPFIGPLTSADFKHNIEVLDLKRAFPDLNPLYFNFSVDFFEHNRVWFFLRPVSTHLGTFQGKLPASFGVPPTGKCISEPPQVGSLTFNTAGEVEAHTMGFVVDRTIGTTGGLGGAFGLLYAIGHPLPVPEGKPWSASWQLRAFNTGNSLIQGLLLIIDRVMDFFLPRFLFTKHSRNTM